MFADDRPLANFGHDCRYLLYDAASGELHSEIPARFPPLRDKNRTTLKAFHEPVRLQPNPDIFWVWPILRCPVLIPDTDMDGVIEAEEAFNYALAVQNPSDSPNYNESSEAGGDVTLGQKYIFWWWWC